MPLPTTHPYYKVDPGTVYSVPPITPSNIVGLLVWNRGDTLAGTNGSTVTTWANIGNAGGPTISCTGTQSNAVLNGSNVVNFTTGQTWTSSSALTPSSYTFFHVARYTSGTYGRIFQSSVASTNQLHGFWNATTQVYYTDTSPSALTGVSVNNVLSNWALVGETRVQAGAYEFRWNGGTIYSGTTSVNSNLNGLSINTGGAAFAEVSTCQVAEVILYNSVLNSNQILGIESYLKTKWGL